MCPTVLGRIETRTIILLPGAILATILSIVNSNEGFIVLLGIYLIMGVILDIAFYPYLIRWQPPWLTFVLAVGEFVILFVIAHTVPKVGLTDTEAVWFYWVVWVMAIWTKIVVLPLFSLSWIENGGEFRFTGWSTPAELLPVPVSVLGKQEAAGGPPPLAIEFSSVKGVPEELRKLPAPSGVRRVPVDLG
ncbi:MAG: hypothetical protein ACR2KV_17020 [Solirubrobacteraceae bacterium]